MDTAVYKPQNEEIQIKLRRYRDALSLSGSMVIALSVWDIVKLFIGFFLGEETIAQIIGTVMEQSGSVVIGTEYEKTVNIILWIGVLLVIMIFSAVVLLYHLYIGLNAYRAGRQIVKSNNRIKKENKENKEIRDNTDKKLYLVLAFLSAIFTGILIIINLYNFFMANDPSRNVDLAFFIMEVTAFVNYIFLLYSAGKIRKLEKAGGEIR